MCQSQRTIIVLAQGVSYKKLKKNTSATNLACLEFVFYFITCKNFFILAKYLAFLFYILTSKKLDTNLTTEHVALYDQLIAWLC